VSQERTEAIVLRGVDFSETSRIITLLSPDRGRLVCMAKGARRPRSPLAGMLDTFNRLEAVYYWKDSRAVQQLGDTTLLNGFAGLKSDLDKATYAGFPLELVYKTVHENEPSHEIYAALVSGLESLERWEGDVRTHCCWQVFRLLSVAGFEPAVEACGVCGGPLSGTLGFNDGAGVTCGSCESDRKISVDSQAALVALGRGTDFCPSLTVDREVFYALWHFAERQLESSFKSVRVIGQMYA